MEQSSIKRSQEEPGHHEKVVFLNGGFASGGGGGGAEMTTRGGAVRVGEVRPRTDSDLKSRPAWIYGAFRATTQVSDTRKTSSESYRVTANAT